MSRGDELVGLSNVLEWATLNLYRSNGWIDGSDVGNECGQSVGGDLVMG